MILPLVITQLLLRYVYAAGGNFGQSQRIQNIGGLPQNLGNIGHGQQFQIQGHNQNQGFAQAKHGKNQGNIGNIGLGQQFHIQGLNQNQGFSQAEPGQNQRNIKSFGQQKIQGLGQNFQIQGRKQNQGFAQAKHGQNQGNIGNIGLGQQIQGLGTGYQLMNQNQGFAQAESQQGMGNIQGYNTAQSYSQPEQQAQSQSSNILIVPERVPVIQNVQVPVPQPYAEPIIQKYPVPYKVPTFIPYRKREKRTRQRRGRRTEIVVRRVQGKSGMGGKMGGIGGGLGIRGGGGLGKMGGMNAIGGGLGEMGGQQHIGAGGQMYTSSYANEGISLGNGNQYGGHGQSLQNANSLSLSEGGSVHNLGQIQHVQTVQNIQGLDSNGQIIHDGNSRLAKGVNGQMINNGLSIRGAQLFNSIQHDVQPNGRPLSGLNLDFDNAEENINTEEALKRFLMRRRRNSRRH